jgi:hypothetical protein
MKSTVSHISNMVSANFSNKPSSCEVSDNLYNFYVLFLIILLPQLTTLMLS